MDLLKIFKREKTKIDLVELYKIQVEKCPFSVGQTVWKMRYNEPVEFVVLSIRFTLCSSNKYLLGTKIGTKAKIQMIFTARPLSGTFLGHDYGFDYGYGYDFDEYYATKEDLIHSFSSTISLSHG